MESSKGVWSTCRAWASEPAWATTSRVWLVPPQEGEGLAEGCVVLNQHDPPDDPNSAHVSLQGSTGR